MDNQKLGEILGANLGEDRPLTSVDLDPVFTNDEVLAMAEGRGYVLGPLATREGLDDGAEPVDTESDTTAPETAEATDRYDDTDALATLSPERQERAIALKTVFAEKFSTSERVLTAEDFGVVLVGEKAVVMFTGGNGVYRGSYNAIMDNKKANKAKYTVELNGQTIDSRDEVTWDLYKAFLASAKAQGITPPDSKQLAESEDNDEPHTGTWLTGEKPDGFYADCGDVDRGRANRDWYDRNNDWYGLRFRPAAAV